MNVVRWVKKNPIGALIGAAAIIGGGYLLLRPAQAAPPKQNVVPPPPPIVTDITSGSVSLTPGHRYRLVVTDPSLAGFSSGTMLLPHLQTGFDKLFGAGVLVVQTADVTGTQATVVFDYKGASAMSVSAANFMVATANIADLGPTPA
jgi:hypothetical protein